MKTKRMKTGISTVALLAMVIFSGMAVDRAAAQSAGPFGNTYEVTIVNLTRGQIFSPPLVIGHRGSYKLFTLGEPASDGLALLAEDGDSSMITATLDGNPQVGDYATASGPVMPGHSTTVTLELRGPFRFITAVGMLVITNDAFFAEQGLLALPWIDNMSEAEDYEAGSEANNESCTYIPGPPCGNGGVRATDGAEGYVHIHAGIHGLTEDLDPAMHDWRNPVAKITVRKMN